MTSLPRILLLIDECGWAFDTIARAIHTHLSDAFSFDILATSDRPIFDDRDYAIIHVLFETENYYRQFLTGHARIVKSVYSHYWELAGLSPQEFVDMHLYDADIVTVPSIRLLRTLSQTSKRVMLCPEGVDTNLFSPPASPRTGPLIVGWAGNPSRPVKRIEWLQQACEELCEFRMATGNLSLQEMVGFYRSIDVIACSSQAEGAPRPLLEGMACGNFPVSFNVGIAEELITSGRNGIIVEEESVTAFRKALQWCIEHPESVRQQSAVNARLMQTYRDWKKTTYALRAVYDALI